jgi:hypothetical protein
MAASLPLRWCSLAAAAIALTISQDRLSAQQFWSWHAFDANVIDAPKLRATLHTRIRTGRPFGEFQQGRTGALLRWTAHPRVGLITGYYYGKEEDSTEEWRNFHRIFAGAEATVRRSSSYALSTRALLERFIPGDLPAFHRYRHRLRLTTPRRLGPYLASEVFIDRSGFLSIRNAAGIQWRVNPAWAVEIGYLHDKRRAAIGDSRHVVVTSLTFSPFRR